MKIDLIAAVDLLKNHDNFLILTHGHPDGDTLGSGMALKYALKAYGKKACVYCGDSVPPKYGYMGIVDEDAGKYDYIVAVDVADAKLLGKICEEKYGNRIQLCIDHHGSNRMYAENTLLDANAAATCEIILEVVRSLGVDIDKCIADCIYTGLSTDTGCFRYSNVTPRTLRMAADMIEIGADFNMINTVMFETKTRTYVALEKLAMADMKMYFDAKCAFVTITQEMYKISGSDESEVDAIASIPRQIEGVLVGVTMREKPDGTYKISMRSHDPVDVAAICAKMGGGGHPRAAGCSAEGTLKEATDIVLKNVKEYIDSL